MTTTDQLTQLNARLRAAIEAWDAAAVAGVYRDAQALDLCDACAPARHEYEALLDIAAGIIDF